MYLFFDTETTGLPIKWKAPVSDLNNWPRLVQLAWILSDSENHRLETGNFIVRPDGFSIPDDAARVHGITTERAMSEGVVLKELLEKFNQLIDRTDFIVAHNIAFDEKIIGAEYLRMDITTDFEKKPKLCTMKASTDYCQIPGPYGYKWPKLSELHIKLFGKDFEGAHDAFADIDATEVCFWKLREYHLV